MNMSSIYYPTPNAAKKPATGVQSSAESIILLPAAQIIPTDTQKIPKIEQNQIIRLAASIKKYGILEPLAVKLGGNDVGFPTYELIEGERRFRAATIAGVERLPCIVLAAGAQKCLRHAFIARLKQENLHFFALADAFYTLFREYGMTQEEIARKMHLSQSAVANKLRLLRLLPEERALIQGSGLSERHARALLRLESPEARREPLMILLSNKQTVAEAERLIEGYLPKKQAKTENLGQKAGGSGQHTMTSSGEEVTPIIAEVIPCIAKTPQPIAEGMVSFAPEDAASEARATEAEQGIMPQKFVLRDLQPLYHSIERALGIFKKTGATVAYSKQEDEHGALITISIPKKA